MFVKFLADMKEYLVGDFCHNIHPDFYHKNKDNMNGQGKNRQVH